jgi:hypothetical protein
MSWKAIVGVWLGSLVTASLGANSSQAQWVDVSSGGGVYVRAPFVSVDVYPHGGVSVRAPYAAVDVGGRPRCYSSQSYVVDRRFDQQSLPTPESLTKMDDDTLRQTMRTTADRLRWRLSGYSTGYLWQEYLRPPDEILAEASADDETYHPAVEKLLLRFQRISADAKFSKLTQFPEFVAMHDVLNEANARQYGAPSGIGHTEELPTPPEAIPVQPPSSPNKSSH